MYDALTMRELNVLQNVLYKGTMDARKVANVEHQDRDWVSRYRPVHYEIGRLFIEAGKELLTRLGDHQEAEAA